MALDVVSESQSDTQPEAQETSTVTPTDCIPTHLPCAAKKSNWTQLSAQYQTLTIKQGQGPEKSSLVHGHRSKYLL